jgi:bacteriochlorophyllide a dehydrogenase
MKTRCLAFTAVNTVALTETTLCAPRAGEIIVETEVSGVSPGTELRCLAGKEIQLGTHSFPFIPGYSLVGKVLAGEGVDSALLGKRVLSTGCREGSSIRCAWGGHMGHVLVPAASVMVLPEAVSSVDAVILKLAAIAYRGVRLCRDLVGKKVAVIGLGPIGQMSARLFHLAGAEVHGFDLAADRVEVLGRAGVAGHLIQGDLGESVRRVLPTGAPVVVDCTGVAALLPQTTRLIADKPWDDSPLPGGTLVIQGSYGSDVALVPPDCFSRELTLIWPRDSQRADLEIVVNANAAGRLNLDGLVGGVFAPSECQEVYGRLVNRTSNLLTAAFDWRR